MTFDMTLINKNLKSIGLTQLQSSNVFCDIEELSKSLQPTPSRTKDAESQQIFRSTKPHRFAATKTTVDYIRSPI